MAKKKEIKTECVCCDEEVGLCEPCDCDNFGKEK